MCLLPYIPDFELIEVLDLAVMLIGPLKKTLNEMEADGTRLLA